jgi:hypothetical protein
MSFYTEQPRANMIDDGAEPVVVDPLAVCRAPIEGSQCPMTRSAATGSRAASAMVRKVLRDE